MAYHVAPHSVAVSFFRSRCLVGDFSSWKFHDSCRFVGTATKKQNTLHTFPWRILQQHMMIIWWLWWLYDDNDASWFADLAAKMVPTSTSCSYPMLWMFCRAAANGGSQISDTFHMHIFHSREHPSTCYIWIYLDKGSPNLALWVFSGFWVVVAMAALSLPKTVSSHVSISCSGCELLLKFIKSVPHRLVGSSHWLINMAYMAMTWDFRFII